MKRYLPSALFLAAVLLLWQLGAGYMNAAYILPTPMGILRKLWELREPLFMIHLPATMKVTAIGLVISIVLGIGLAILMDASPVVEQALYPIVIASQTIPTTAIAPLFVVWFGYGIWSKIVVTILMTFFPITITVFDGFKSVKREMEELLISYGATKKDIIHIALTQTVILMFSGVLVGNILFAILKMTIRKYEIVYQQNYLPYIIISGVVIILLVGFSYILAKKATKSEIIYNIVE